MPVRETLSSVETVFARTEHLETTVRAEVEAKIARVRHVLARRDARAAVLTQAGSVAWVTAGITNPIERGNPASPLWVVVTSNEVTALTTNVEHPRLREPLARIGLSLKGVAWYEPAGLAGVAAEIVGSGAARLVSDEPSLGDGADDLVAIRLSLLLPERERLTTLGQDTVAALESALRAWRPGERDFDVQARAGERLERVGALAVCLFVGGDERVERFRHPLPVGAPIHRFVMAAVVAERGGLHVATTRFASAGPLPKSLATAQATAHAIEGIVLDACRPGSTYGDVLDALAGAYVTAGHAEAWRDHYQGGPIGYRQREFEIVPTQKTSRWYDTPLADGHALAWNPSVFGGGKSEDTFLLSGAELRQLTVSTDWPTMEVAGRARAAVLDIATGEAA
jgi:Xaa-Pro dipeptidase